jgi:hypothetical protein
LNKNKNGESAKVMLMALPFLLLAFFCNIQNNFVDNCLNDIYKTFNNIQQHSTTVEEKIMEPQDLIKVWDAPDNSKLTPKQLSIRLPILVAAKISALCDLYPRKTKTEIIGDLLSTALDQFGAALPSQKGEQLGYTPDNEPYYEDVGLSGQFHSLTGKYLRELEKEAGIKESLPWSTLIVTD